MKGLDWRLVVRQLSRESAISKVRLMSDAVFQHIYQPRYVLPFCYTSDLLYSGAKVLLFVDG